MDNFDYYVAGRRAYFFGGIDGNAENIGWHLKGKMGGFWLDNYRLFSSYFLSLNGKRVSPTGFQNKVSERIVNYPGADLRILAHPERPLISIRIESRAKIEFCLRQEMDLVWLEDRPSGNISLKVENQDRDTIVWRELERMSSFVKVNGKATSEGDWLKLSKRGTLEAVIALGRPGKEGYEQYFLEREEHNRRYLPPFQDTIPFWARAGALELFFERDVGCGFVAGLGEFPWWFGIDGVYTCLGLLETPMLELVGKTVDNLAKFGNGLAPHEVTTAGRIYAYGRMNEIIAFAYLALKYAVKTSKKEYLELVDNALSHVSGHLSRKLYPQGEGIVEVPISGEFALLDSACWLYSMLKELRDSNMMKDLKNSQFAAWLLERYDREFLKDWYGKDGLFYDALTEKSANFEGHFIQIYPLSMGLIRREIGERLLAKMEKIGYFKEPGLIHSLPLKTFEAGDYGEGDKNDIVWSLPTLLAIEAGIRYGRPDLSEKFILSLENSLKSEMYGALPEILPAGGCTIQAWNAYAIALIEHMNSPSPAC